MPNTAKIANQQVTMTGFVLNSSKEVLLVRRSESEKHFPGVYEMAGGKVDFGEDIFAALKREYKEETNLDIEIVEPFYTFSYMSSEGRRHNVEIVYKCELVSESQEVILSADHDDYKWLDRDNALQTMSDSREGDIFDDHIYQAVKLGFEKYT